MDYSVISRRSCDAENQHHDISAFADTLDTRGLAVSNSNLPGMIRHMRPKGRPLKVCIVGAGLAGLRCAQILGEAGVSVTILEVRDRTGGRVQQSHQLGHLCDVGCNWIHGTENNPILDIAKDVGSVLYTQTEEDNSIYDEHGSQLNQDKAMEHNKVAWSIIGDAFKLSAGTSSSIPQDESLFDFLREEVRKKDLDDTSQRLVLQMAEIWGDFIGDSIEKQSLKYLWLEECIEGENLFVASTYEKVLDHITKAGLRKATLRLGTKVTEIRSEPTGIEEPGVVQVSIEQGEPQNYDAVVTTTPLGYLKHHLDMFKPPLPAQLRSAIDHISYGRLEKVYITFPTAFWSPEAEPRPFFIQFLHPNYANDLNPEGWSVVCASLASLPEPHRHPTLLFYIHGPCAEHVTSLIHGLSPDESAYLGRLRDFFEPYYSRLPNFSSTQQPIAALATNWQYDEYAGYGSYTNFQVAPTVEHGGEDIKLDQDLEMLRRGAPERNIYFAGEHTAPFIALGTTTGAYWSGEAVARRVLDAYDMQAAGTEVTQGEGLEVGRESQVDGTSLGSEPGL